MSAAETRRGEVVTVEARAVRAISYGPNGRTMEHWLPSGVWQVDGECSLAPCRATGGVWAAALILFRPAPLKHEGVFYVHPSRV